jgi:CSLREA domain-containing protein
MFRLFAGALPLLALLSLALLWRAGWPDGASGGPVITVDTTEDLAMGNGNCSFREAIDAANLGALVDNCDGTVSDTITFDLGSGTPTINVATQLPTVTAPVTIRGNTGGATRVELRGPGNGTALYLDAGADGTVIQRLVINTFQFGIEVAANDVVIKGNYIGTDATGAMDAGNTYGIYLSGGERPQIGGTSGVTPGGICSGDCNLVSGNFTGIYVSSSPDTVIQGNFIGTTANGEGALGNDTGIHNQGMGTTIGGATAGAGNLISGNEGVGTDTYFFPSMIQGNLIGTDTDGETAIANATGIVLEDNAGTQVGGAGAARNVISGNAGPGVYLRDGASATVIEGNLIGTAADGASPLGNSEAGIELNSSSGNLIGASGGGPGNTIAFNGGDGVRVSGDGSGGGTGNAIQGNSIHSNGGKGIENIVGGNNEIDPPVITGTGSAFGTACPNCEIDVFSDGEDEGRVYEGKVAADGSGNWMLPGPLSGPFVTATATDPANNTSEFSAPFALPATPTPSPSPSGSPTHTATASAAGTASPTASGEPTATATPSASPGEGTQTTWGNANCSGPGRMDPPDPVDSLLTLRHDAGLGANTGDCPPLGTEVDVLNASLHTWGDVDCSGAVDPVDSLKVLRSDAGLSVSQEAGCPGMGAAVTIVVPG